MRGVGERYVGEQEKEGKGQGCYGRRNVQGKAKRRSLHNPVDSQACDVGKAKRDGWSKVLRVDHQLRQWHPADVVNPHEAVSLRDRQQGNKGEERRFFTELNLEQPQEG